MYCGYCAPDRIHINCMLLLLQICTIGVHYLSCPKDDHQKACSIGKDHGFLSLSFNNAPQKADVAQSETVLYSHLVSMSSYN